MNAICEVDILRLTCNHHMMQFRFIAAECCSGKHKKRRIKQDHRRESLMVISYLQVGGGEVLGSPHLATSDLLSHYR